MYFERLWHSFAGLPEVTAIALGGSRVTGSYDEKSDYDLYIYCDTVPDDSVRRQILETNCSYIEQGNAFWELEDDCTLKDGVDIDILYRSISEIADGLTYVVEGCHPSNAYTTCIWHNILTCRVLYDREGALGKLIERFSVPYPEKLRQNIIKRGMRLLHGNLPSYDAQIQKAAKRGDLISVNHRTAAFLETCFDVIFALNRMTHPGEKRMLQTAVDKAEILPEDFEKNINILLRSVFTDLQTAEEALNSIVTGLERIIKDHC
ncbi:MAG: DUF4037 domain-containing protein [Ruminococcus sp.]|jgi:hypothetical protein|uniref:DUF4037 domain-containing protein n=1 Tax=Ruminococcus sp. TaxID=41978 RepID=UPI0029318DA0|nr:DUF4037 domain-containing protein [uncultured Ruminococcus sp.]MBQ1474246.1 DUF4037 domain-containing protein [Ruminococcus sp.]MBQ6412765.1 DUF4037 domain-containing protein [Ruminococcus sp.]